MSYEIVFTEIFAGCLFATALVAFRIRLEKVRNPGSRTKASRHTFQNAQFRSR